MKDFIRILLLAVLVGSIHAQPRPVKIPTDQWQQAEQLARANRGRESLERFKQLLAGCVEIDAFRNAGLILKNAGAAAEAERLFLWARKQLDKPEAFAPELAGLYQEQLRYPEAVHQWSLLLKDGAGTAAAGIDAIGVQAGYAKTAAWMEREGRSSDLFLRTRGELWLRAGDPTRAWASFRRIGGLHQISGLLNNLLNRSGIPARDAVRFISDYLARKPQDRAVWELRLAEALNDDGKPDEAARLLETAAGRNDPAAGLMRARIFLRDLHRPDRSREVLAGDGRRWPEPFRSEARFLLAEALMAQSRWDSARQTLLPLADSTRDIAVRQRSLLLLAETSFLLQDFDEAAAQYGRVAALGPAGDAVNDALSRLLLISGNKADKIEFLRALAAARSLQAQFRFSEADRGYQALAELEPGGAIADEARASRAEMAEQLRDYRRAAGLYSEAERYTADTTFAAEALYRAGKLGRGRLGDPALARRTWEQGIRKYPDTSWADLMRSELEKMKPGKEE